MEPRRASQSRFTCRAQFGGSGQNAGMAFVNLKDWSERGANDSVEAVAGRAMGAFSQIKDANVFAFAPPAVTELGTSNGFTFYLKDMGGLGHDGLLAARNQFLGMASQTSYRERAPTAMRTPQFRIRRDVSKPRPSDSTGLSDNPVVVLGLPYIDDFTPRTGERVRSSPDALFGMAPRTSHGVRNAKARLCPSPLRHH